jgi:predicted NUDIX family NTP pyrophosphohydrolase
MVGPGRKIERLPKAAVAFPEVDRPAWFDLDAGRSKILLSQTKLLDRFDKGLA